MKILGFLVLFLVFATGAVAQEKEQVDVLLVLASDASGSITDGELELQVLGVVEAMSNYDVVEAVQGNNIGKIAVSYIIWHEEQWVLVPWTIISDNVDAQAFARSAYASFLDWKLKNNRRSTVSTDLAGAIRRSVDYIENSPYEGLRKVIDISGDGQHNTAKASGAHGDLPRRVINKQDVEDASLYAFTKGVIINGFPIGSRRESSELIYFQELVDYYRESVVGYTGGFVMQVLAENSYRNYIEGFERKLILEISGDDSIVMPEYVKVVRNESENKMPKQD